MELKTVRWIDTSSTMTPSHAETAIRPETSISQPSETNNSENRLAPFNPTNNIAQIRIIELLKLRDGDVLFDLGSGDGRFLITAATREPGLRCVGIEYDPGFVARAEEAVSALPEPVKQRIAIRQGDVLQEPIHREGNETTGVKGISLADATTVYVFLLPKGLKKLKRLLDLVVEERRRQNLGLRVVAYMFQIHGWEPSCVDRNTKSGSAIYVYNFPAT